MKKELESEYLKNRIKYDNIESEIKKNINGRICHHGVRILNIIVNLYDIKNYLEIGVHNGSSMSYVVNNDKKINCIGIDLFENTSGHYLKDNITKDNTFNNISLNNKKSNINLIKGNSNDPETMIKLENVLKDDKIDLFFIDGDHSYKGVKNDFNSYIKYVSKNGLIVFDDYNRRWPDVVKFCDELDYNLYEKIGLFFDNELIIRKK